MENSNGADLSQLTPTDEREITRQLAERSICKDVPVWKGYVEVNVENPMKTKKLKFSKKILVVSKYRLFLCDVKKTQRELDYYLMDAVSIKVHKPGCFSIAFKKNLHALNKFVSLKKLSYININTDDDRKVERYIIKAIQEGVRNSTFSWKVSKLEVDVQGTWIMDLAPEKISIAEGLVDSYWSLCDYRSKPVDRNFIRFIKDKCGVNDHDMDLSSCPGIESKHASKSFHVETIAESLSYNTYFHSFTIENVVCKEAAEAASIVMMKNRTVRKLVIKNCSTAFSSNFGYALYYNKGHNLSVIDLSQNSMPNAASIPFAQSLFHLQHVITVLNLGGLGISSRALATLAQSLGTNWGLSLGLEELDISGNEGEAASAAWGHWFTSIGSDAKLRRLSLANSSFVGSYVLKSLKELPLTFLDISGMKMGPNFNKTDDADLALLLSTSRTLQVFRCTETIKEISSFIDVLKSGVAKNPNGQEWHIDLSKTNIFSGLGVTDRSAELAEAISLCANLNTLNIGGIGLKAKGLVAVLNALPKNIMTLVIDDNFEGSPVSQEELGNTLAKLLENHPAITFLSLAAKSSQSGLPLRPLFKSLKRNKTLMYLNIAGNDVGDAVFATLCRSLCVNATLIGLRFWNNNLSINGFLALEQMLQVNTTLQFIEFIEDYNAFYDKYCTEKNSGELLRELHECCILRRAGVTWHKDIFAFDSVSWDTPETVSPLLPVPPRLAAIKADWNKLTEMVDEAAKTLAASDLIDTDQGDGDDDANGTTVTNADASGLQNTSSEAQIKRPTELPPSEVPVTKKSTGKK